MSVAVSVSVCLNVCVNCRPQFVEATMNEKGHFIPHSSYFNVHFSLFILQTSFLRTYELPFDKVLPEMADEER